MVDERIALLEEMYNASVRRMDLQILLQGIVSRWRGCANSGGDLIERSDGLQWLLITYAHTYAIVTQAVLRRLSSSEYTMAAILGRLRAKSTKQLLYQEARGLNDVISKSEEHFGADSIEVGYALTSILQLRKHTALSLQHRAWT
jgi:hypothetical protein